MAENDTDALRRQIIELCRRHAAATAPGPFVPGETFIPASGKVVDGDDLAMLVEASLDMWLTAGRFAEAFEARLAETFGLRHARMTVSGSAANLLAFSTLCSPRLNERAIPPGSEVLTVAAGFPTTVTPIIQNGCVPVFVDIDPATHNVDAARLAEAVTPATRAIMLAHTLGNPFDLGAVSEIARGHGLYLVEDCCDALGARWDGRHVGTFGDLATVSFYPAHHITTGEGGAVLTRNKALAKLAESLRDWGRDCWCPPGRSDSCGKRFDWHLGELPPGYDHKYTYSQIGYNLKATDMQAALGLSQLDKLPGFVARRNENWRLLRDAFRREGLDEFLILPETTPGAEPSWFGFLLTVREGAPFGRNDLIRRLEERRIGTRLLFAGNLTRQPAFAAVRYRIHGDLTHTDRTMRDSFWVGVWPGIGEAGRGYMVETFRTVITGLAGRL